MPFIAKVGRVEIACSTIEELDQIVERYAELGEQVAQAGNGAAPRPQGGSVGALDHALLRVLADAGTGGVETKRIEGMASAKGKALRSALKAWAVRVGLSQDPGAFPFEEARIGTRRGWKLQEGALEAARILALPKP